MFITKYGEAMVDDDDPAAITKEFAKLLKLLFKINGRKGLGFYAIRACLPGPSPMRRRTSPLPTSSWDMRLPT